MTIHLESSPTIKEQVRPLLEAGLSIKEIAYHLGLPTASVYRARWRIENAERYAAASRAEGKQRYGTEAYRQEDRERKYRRYHSDPYFRQGCLNASARYRAKQMQKREASAASTTRRRSNDKAKTTLSRP